MYKIFSIVFDRVDFLFYQVKLFKKFIHPEIDFYCVDNSMTSSGENEFRKECDKLQIKHVLVPDKYFGEAGASHQNAANYIIKQYISSSEQICLLIDADIFPIKSYIITEDFGLAGLSQGHNNKKYLWPGMLIINPKNCKEVGTLDVSGAFLHKTENSYYIPDIRTGFTFDSVDALLETHYSADSGALIYDYIRRTQPAVKTMALEHIRHREESINYIPEGLIGRYQNDYVYWVIDKAFLHFSRSSNWDNMANEQFNNKIELLKEWLNQCI